MNWTKGWFAVLLIGGALQASAQSTSTNGAATNQPANAWLLTPTPYLRATDSVSQAVRTARDQYFDEVFGAAFALKADTASLAHIAHDTSVPDVSKVPEIPQNPDRAILSGAFSKFGSIFSQSQHSIYTELVFSVDHVFADPTGQVAAGATVTLIVPGGSVQTSSGTLSYLVDPEQFFVQPQNLYLVVLSYHSDGDFYTLAKNWELLNGVVMPNSKLEQDRAAKGKSSLAGIPENQLPTLLQAMTAATASY